MSTLRQLFAFSAKPYHFTATQHEASRRHSPELPDAAFASSAGDDGGEGASCCSQSAHGEDEGATLVRKRLRGGNSSTAVDTTACQLRCTDVRQPATTLLAAAPRPRLDVLKPTKERIARALARVWSTMLEQSRGSTVGRGIIYDADEWSTAAHEYLCDDFAQGFSLPTHSAASCDTKDSRGDSAPDARWLIADDEERWVRTFSALSAPLYASSPLQLCTVRSESFTTSEQAVTGLMLHLASAHSVCDTSVLLLAVCLLRRLLLRHAVFPRSPLFAAVEGAHADQPSTQGVFRWFRRHELRVLMACVGIAVKVHSDYYVTCAFLVAMLPRATTRPLDEAQRSAGGAACAVPERNHRRSAVAQQRKPSPSKARDAIGRTSGETVALRAPAFSDSEMAWWERWIVGPRGLQYHLRVTGEEALQVLGLYASPEDAALLRNFLQSQSFHAW